jgi:DNA-binding NarL/FixJ family response regulator
MSAIRVLVVDDHVIVRQGIRQVLLSTEGFAVVGEAGNASDALSLAKREHPDVVLLDITLPGDSGLATVAPLRAEVPGARVLILSVHDDAEYVLESVRAGAHGYLRKDTTPADLRAAIRAVHGGGEWFSPVVARRLTERIRAAGRPETARPTDPLAALTNREREVLLRVAQGRLNKEIAAELGISVRTVEAHRDSLSRKLGVRNAAGLTRAAIEGGLLADGG